MIRVACLGAGYFSHFHRDGWARITGAACVGVADHDLDKAKATGLPAFDNLGDLLATTQPDVLDIILPPSAHATAITQALNAGVTTIICQKPFCQSLDEATRITQMAEQAGATLIVHENFRFQPWFRAIAAQIAAGAIGRVSQVTFRLRPGDGQGDDAYLDRQPYFRTMPRFLVHETGVHYVDTFRFLLGEPMSVYADLRRVNPVIAGEDAGHILFEYAGGVRALLDGNRTLDHAATNTRCTMGEGLIEGDAGTLTLYGDGSVNLRQFGSLDADQILPPDETGTFGGDCTHALQAHVIAAMQGKGKIENTARDYLSVIATEMAIYRSSEQGKKLDLTTDGPRQRQG